MNTLFKNTSKILSRGFSATYARKAAAPAAVAAPKSKEEAEDLSKFLKAASNYEFQQEDENVTAMSEITSEVDTVNIIHPDSPKNLPVTFTDIEEARRRIGSHIRKTPLQFSYRLSKMTENRVFLKMENLQMTGAYKERGALNKLCVLTPEQKAKGVIAASAGNHAQGLSYQATRLGVDAVIVMPTNTPLSKVAGTKRWGAKVVLHGQGYDDAYNEAVRIAEREGRTFVHAFNDPYIVAGQGTVGLEILEQNPYLDAVICPIGGGGLIAGVSLVLKEINPRIRIFGVQTDNMPSMKVSVNHGKVTEVPFSRTIADGIAVKKVGNVPFELVKHFVDDIVTVDEDEISSAILTLMEVEKTIVEGAGAAALAGLLSNKLDLKNKRVAVICSGGNIDPTVLGKIIDRGLVKDGRMTRLRVSVLDSPGNLANALKVVADAGCNVREVEHERAFNKMPVGYTQTILTMETRGHEHIAEVKALLEQKGFLVSLDFETPMLV